MKVMTSKEVQNSFGHFLDTAQHEPVVVTRHNRPAGVMISMDNIGSIFELADSMRDTIRQGIASGIADSEAGRTHELTDSYVESLKVKAQQRINANTEK